jgi:NAD(P)-dependent dehydrogenase (short-subunit alcohol dehydrogenase family)
VAVDNAAEAPRRSLAGKKAIVTGAGRGLGRGIARGLAVAGAAVAILEMDPAGGAEARDELTSLGVATLSIVTDVSDSAQVDTAFDEVAAAFGRLDILVNNAGISRTGPDTDEVTDKDWADSIGVMQSGVFYCMRAAAKLMIPQRSGSIVNISSLRGFSPRPGRMTYSAAKAAVLMMTQIAAGEWGCHGVRVNSIAPGFMKTPMHDADVARGTFDEESLLAAIPLGRLGAPDDLARLVTFLCSDDASYITGTCIVIDGGLSTIPSA